MPQDDLRRLLIERELGSTDTEAARLARAAIPKRDTNLPDEHNEAAFQKWYGDWAKRHHMNPDPDAKEQHFDYRAAFRAGVTPPDVSKGEHWASGPKDKDHPHRVVGGVDTVTGDRVPGTRLASEQELVQLGWDPATAKELTAKYKGK